MQNIKNIELLPQFFLDVKKQYAATDLKNGNFIVAIMADLLPGAEELRRCIRMVYESNAMASILDLSNDSSNLQVCRGKAINRMIDYSFMDMQTAASIIDSVIAAVYPEIKHSPSAEEQYRLGKSYYEKGNKNETMCHSASKEKRMLVAQLSTVLKNKLRKDLDEQLYIYQVMQITPPEDYLQIRAKL